MQDKIGYDLIVEEAMRTIIPKVLGKTGKEGLKGDHHFIITFSTKYSGVVLSDFLKEKFPSQMTIILQHQFQSLVVLEDCFKISLSFSGVMEKLTIPYKAILSFNDPSVNFGLNFKPQIINDEVQENEKTAKQEISKNNDENSKIISLADFKKNRDKK